MAREIPEAVRAAAGLAATVLDEARRLPETLPGLPVRALGLAMQLSMKVQQHYAGLVARGDELFTGLRGEDEPGLATFDDEEPAGPVERVGRSAFDRVAETVIEVTEEDGASAADEALDELAIEDLVEQTADVSETVDVLTPGGGIDTVEATVTDEGVAAPETAAPETAAPETAAPEGTASTTMTEATGTSPVVETPTDLSAPPTAPVEGYDDWSIAQLRGRLRGYAPATVQELLSYEEATQAREPYLRMLRNRMERLSTNA